MQNEIKTAGPLLDSSGALAQTGYARSLLLDYNRKSIKASRLRIKEWDYYLVYNEEYAVALTIADNAYIGLVSASIIHFKDPFEKTTSVMIPLTMGQMRLSSTSQIGDVSLRYDNVNLSFKNDGKTRRLLFNMQRFDKKESLTADIELSSAPRDSMVIAMPFPKKPKAFYYNQKIIGMRAKGTMRYKDREYDLGSAGSFGLLDWGRGVWPYDNTWYWGAGQGIVNGKVFGFNIGYGFGDASAATENMLFYDGIAHKLEHVSFNIPKTSGNKDDFMRPWTFSSSDGRFEMDFQPIIDRAALISLGIIYSNQHQVFGRFTGKAVLDDGSVIELRDFLGFAEKVHNKW